MSDAGLVTEAEMIRMLRRGQRLGQLMVRAKVTETRGVDALVEIAWNDRTYEFAAEFKARSTPRAVEEAVQQARRWSERTGRPPLVVVPYLSEERLKRLESMKVSGIDLCDNGVVVIPGELYVFRSGRPNRYRDSIPTKYAYRGVTSLVPRVFLCRPSYERVSDIRTEVEARGGRITLATVSKALKRMDEDALITRGDNVIRLVQPDALLDKLSASYQAPRARLRQRLSMDRSLEELFGSLSRSVSAVLSGASSGSRYAVTGRDSPPTVYCRDVDEVLAAWGKWTRPAERFVDLDLCETDAVWVYFDARREGSIKYASPVQTYLELASGDKRDKQAAEQVRERILKELKQ